MHDGNLPCGPAKTDKAQLEPIPEGLRETNGWHSDVR